MNFEISTADMLRYYLAWEDYEKELIQGPNKGNSDSFYKYLSGMKVLRNFKSGSIKSSVFNISKDFISSSKNHADAELLSKRFLEADVLNNRIKNSIVAASKILWFFNLNTIIMDALARKYLQKLSGEKIEGYISFCDTWEKQYAKFKPELIRKLEETGIYKISKLYQEEWFLKRTFDNYLWSKGKNIK